MAVIRVLDKHTAELIAAGEVVERPASVVKELLENAIDAGATKITISIESGGIRCIEVSDNGSGIEAEYISTAFIRHATSKIATEEDLFSISTLGFRGEALASIASVARVEVLTRTEQDEFACLYRIEGGEELPLEPGARAVGTTIRVRDLFYNTPARMKFLKKDSSEGTFVADIVAHVALSHPEISFKFIREGKTQYVTPGSGRLADAALTVLGREFGRGLLPVEYECGMYRLTGLITPPRSCRASRSMQYFYINGRYVKNRTMMAGLEGAFKGTTMQGKFPGGILCLELPADQIDVNVHPAKTEVRFAHENDVFDIVYHAVKLALAQPGSGERLFTFDREKDAAEETEAEAKPAGLAAVRPGQAVPGMLKNEPKLRANPESSPKLSSSKLSGRLSGEAPVPLWKEALARMRAQRESVPSHEDILETVVTVETPEGAPVNLSPTLYSPEREDWEQPETASFRKADHESALDIHPDEEEFGVPYQSGAQKSEPEKPIRPEYPAAERLEMDNSKNNGESKKTKEKDTVKNNCFTDKNNEETTDSKASDESAAAAPAQTCLFEEDGEEPLQYVGELFRTYIIAQRGDEMCLIDKHAAHERQLFEKLAADYGSVPGQLLLSPVTVELSAEEKQAVLDNLPLLENAGLEVGDFGGSTVLVRAVPADVTPSDAAQLLEELAAKLAEGSRDALSERTEWVLHSISCRAAIKAGDRSTPQELLALAEKILSGEVPPFCPHGRPCVLKLTRKELEKQFGRLV